MTAKRKEQLRRELEVIKARREAEIKYYGEFAPTKENA